MDDPLINPHRDDEDQWMPLSERARISQAIYDSLRMGGLELRFVNGLEMLRLVAMTMDPPTI